MSITATDCARALFTSWNPRFEVAAIITSHTEAQFTSALWAPLCNLKPACTPAEQSRHSRRTGGNPLCRGRQAVHRHLPGAAQNSCGGWVSITTSWGDLYSLQLHPAPQVCLSVPAGHQTDSTSEMPAQSLRGPVVAFPLFCWQTASSHVTYTICETQTPLHILYQPALPA